MDKVKLYIELVKVHKMKDAISILRGRKNRFSKEEVAAALGNKKAVKKSKKIFKKESKEIFKQEFKEESNKSNSKKKSKKKSKN